jgi:hypothetical protein
MTRGRKRGGFVSRMPRILPNEQIIKYINYVPGSFLFI